MGDRALGHMSDYRRLLGDLDEHATQHARPPPRPVPHVNGAKTHILITVASLIIMGVSGMVLTEYRVGAIEKRNEKVDAARIKLDEALAGLATTQGRILERLSTTEREIDRLRDGRASETKRVPP